MDDLISRQAAIDIADDLRACISVDGYWAWTERLKRLPSAQPERKKGFWYALEKGDKGYSAGDFKCSVCGEPNRCYSPKPYYCPNCGADMRGENDGE